MLVKPNASLTGIKNGSISGENVFGYIKKNVGPEKYILLKFQINEILLSSRTDKKMKEGILSAIVDSLASIKDAELHKKFASIIFENRRAIRVGEYHSLMSLMPLQDEFLVPLKDMLLRFARAGNLSEGAIREKITEYLAGFTFV
jgi:hypothetical protein